MVRWLRAGVTRIAVFLARASTDALRRRCAARWLTGRCGRSCLSVLRIENGTKIARISHTRSIQLGDIAPLETGRSEEATGHGSGADEVCDEGRRGSTFARTRRARARTAIAQEHVRACVRVAGDEVRCL